MLYHSWAWACCQASTGVGSRNRLGMTKNVRSTTCARSHWHMLSVSSGCRVPYRSVSTVRSGALYPNDTPLIRHGAQDFSGVSRGVQQQLTAQRRPARSRFVALGHFNLCLPFLTASFLVTWGGQWSTPFASCAKDEHALHSTSRTPAALTCGITPMASCEVMNGTESASVFIVQGLGALHVGERRF